MHGNFVVCIEILYSGQQLPWIKEYPTLTLIWVLTQLECPDSGKLFPLLKAFPALYCVSLNYLVSCVMP